MIISILLRWLVLYLIVRKRAPVVATEHSLYAALAWHVSDFVAAFLPVGASWLLDYTLTVMVVSALLSLFVLKIAFGSLFPTIPPRSAWIWSGVLAFSKLILSVVVILMALASWGGPL